MRLIAKMPTLAAIAYKTSIGAASFIFSSTASVIASSSATDIHFSVPEAHAGQ